MQSIILTKIKIKNFIKVPEIKNLKLSNRKIKNIQLITVSKRQNSPKHKKIISEI